MRNPEREAATVALLHPLPPSSAPDTFGPWPDHLRRKKKGLANRSVDIVETTHSHCD